MNKFLAIKITVILIAAYLLTGCYVPSINPFFITKSPHIDSKLNGTWTSKALGNLKIESINNTHYKITATDEGGQFDVYAELILINNQLFANTRVYEWKKVNMAQLFSLLPVFNLLKINFVGDNIVISALNIDKVESILSNNKKIPSYTKMKPSGNLLLTAETTDLQSFIVEHMNDEGLFKQFDVLSRK